jgi:hypothetical protein
MERLTLQAHVGHDGILRLETLVGVADVDCEVVVTVPAPPPPMTPDEWNAFIDRTAGSLAHDPMERLPQGEYEPREPIP